MAQFQIKGKSIMALARDIVEGYSYLNSVLLKKFDGEAFKGLHHALRKIQNEVRAEKFPLHDVTRLRRRNLRLQRLHQAIAVLEYAAKERKFMLQ